MGVGDMRTGGAHAADPGEYSYVPLRNVSSAAGGGAVVDSEQTLDFLAFKTWWVRQELRVPPAALVAIWVSGESMEPTLHQGDVVLVDTTPVERITEGVYVLRMDRDLLIKRLQRLPGGLIEARSDNTAYAPFQFRTAQLGTSDLVIVGKAVWMGHKL